MDGTHTAKCESLLQQCKVMAKSLLEISVTNRKVHWTHPSFISFCLSVDDVMSYGVRRKYTTVSTSRSKATTTSRVLHELGKRYPVANSIYTQCFESSPTRRKPDYSHELSDTYTEHRIVWIRTAIVEKVLQPIVGELRNTPGLYYVEKSVMCHPVYGELFYYLIEGPCSLVYSRLRSLDSTLISPAPSEIVDRHNRVIPAGSDHNTSFSSQDTPSGEVWEHVQSLYQSSISTCLFGKNNVLMEPPGFNDPLGGYLMLVQSEDSLLLKWLPNTLINGARHNTDASLLWTHVLSIDITNDVAHLHCHQGAHPNETILILVGYNGIAYPKLQFPQPSSMINFLEAIENGIHPKGSLEPPVWFLRQQQKERSTSLSSTLRSWKGEGVRDFPTVWHQVFRVRFTKTKDTWEEEGTARVSNGKTVSLSSTSLSSFPAINVFSGPAPSRPLDTIKQTPLRKQKSIQTNELESFQSKVSRQLLARYFYSWLSYCRHIARIKRSLAHLILPVTAPPSPMTTTTSTQPFDEQNGLTHELWEEYLRKRDNETWTKVSVSVYSGGMPHELRPQVWPYLLGLYTPTSSSHDCTNIVSTGSASYTTSRSAWKSLERHHYINNDPTSTSIDIRLADEPVATVSMTTDEQTMATENMASPLPDNVFSDQMEDLIVFADESHDSHVTENRTSISPTAHMIVEKEEGRDSGWEDHAPSGSDDEVCHHNGEESTAELSKHESDFLQELIKIDKDIPRCDRDYWYFQNSSNLGKLRNITATFIWCNMELGYSQGMCDLLSPLLVIFDDEVMAYLCFEHLMHDMSKYFPPKTGMSERLSNLQSLLQVLEEDFFQYLVDQPMGDALFYCYRWFLVNFKREFIYNDIYLLWEISWSARWCETQHFELFVGLAILQQYKNAIMDAQLDSSEILNLFTELADKKMFDCRAVLSLAQSTVRDLQRVL